MELWIEGKCRCSENIRIQGSKNAALPLMAAALLHEGITILEECPQITDVFQMEHLLQEVGVKSAWEGHTLRLDCRKLQTGILEKESVGKIRASVLLLGSLLGRTGQVNLPRPGGCAIGRRPVDLHVQVLSALGAAIAEKDTQIEARVDGRLRGTDFRFSKVSVGATENGLLAAAKAEGVTHLSHCAREPEITHLCHFLQQMGVEIRGIGTGDLWIRGGSCRKEVRFRVPADRIAAGTCLFAAAAARCRMDMENAPAEEMAAVLSVYEKMGGQWEYIGGTLRADARRVKNPVPEVETAEYPGFPTDLQSVLLAALLTMEGESRILETIFENRFQVVEELRKMGGRVEKRGREVRIFGGSPLIGCPVKAKELRGGAALLVAALAAEGRTVIKDAQYICRGYEDPAGLFSSFGRSVRIREW